MPLEYSYLFHQLDTTIAFRPTGNRIVKMMRKNLFSSIMRQDIAFFDRTRTGELINRLSADTSVVGQSVTMNISDGLRSVVQACAGVSMMVRDHRLIGSPLTAHI